MSKKKNGMRLRQLKVKNFKALDSITIDFPSTRMSGDPDVIIMGSKNGIGKTSVLEACALLILAASLGEKPFDIGRHSNMPIDIPDLLIRSGAHEAIIEGNFSVGKKESTIELILTKSGGIKIKGDTEAFRSNLKQSRIHTMDLMDRFVFSLVGFNSEPLIIPPVLYFHSYRKVMEGNPELGMMVEGERTFRRSRYRTDFEFPISAFKLQILRLMMGKARLFETLDDEHASDMLDKLNELVNRYSGGTIEKLRPSSDNTVDFRIYQSNGEKSFTFDGLSSGQKEIISTLFLIWYYSKTKPSIVLIDEPELHLNVEWHMDFVKQVHDLAPENQYIIATHSEDIFSSVEEDRRILLVPSEDNRN